MAAIKEIVARFKPDDLVCKECYCDVLDHRVCTVVGGGKPDSEIIACYNCSCRRAVAKAEGRTDA